jgi:hypothetical protein
VAEAVALRQHPPTLCAPGRAIGWSETEVIGEQKARNLGEIAVQPLCAHLTYNVIFSSSHAPPVCLRQAANPEWPTK